jgi:hypothetical protein
MTAGHSGGERLSIFDRGARLDIEKPGTGLGLAIVRDVAHIYGGSVVLEESEDLGGLLARLKLPLCAPDRASCLFGAPAATSAAIVTATIHQLSPRALPRSTR